MNSGMSNDFQVKSFSINKEVLSSSSAVSGLSVFLSKSCSGMETMNFSGLYLLEKAMNSLYGTSVSPELWAANTGAGS